MIENFYFSLIDKNFANLVIFDRDDTLIRDVPNLKKVTDITWLPGRLNLLKTLNKQSSLIAIATNQSAIGRGDLTIEEFNIISDFIYLELQKIGVDLWAVVACPHLPSETCKCRKPRPGLLNRLVEEAQLEDLEVFFVGNAESDIEAAKSADTKITGIMLDPSTADNFEVITSRLVQF